MKAFHRRPEAVEAVRWDGTSIHAYEISAWLREHGQSVHAAYSPGDGVGYCPQCRYDHPTSMHRDTISIQSDCGAYAVDSGDWVVWDERPGEPIGAHAMSDRQFTKFYAPEPLNPFAWVGSQPTSWLNNREDQ